VFDGYSKQEWELRWLKRWIWVYFWLLIFEGVLRKWVVPSLSGPLLLIRDPVALMVYYQAYRCGRFSMKRMWPIALIGAGITMLACAQVMMEIETIPIALFGLHSYVLHLPMIFIIAETLDGEDLYKLGRWLLLLSIPMSVLVMAQYRSPGGAWLNAGAGEDAGQIISAGGHIRPAGTFSFGAGMGCLEVLFGAILLDALMRKERYPRWLLWCSLVATAAMIPALGSRTVLFSMAALIAFTLVAGMTHAARVVGLVKVAVVLVLAGVVVIQIPVFNEAVATMTQRWQEAGKSEGGVQEVLNQRVFGVFEIGLDAAATTPWLGQGIGMGSSFASVSQTGTVVFMLGETEWERVIPEFGPIAGLLFMGARVAFAAYLVLLAFRALKRNEPLAWQLLPAVLPVLVLDIMEQPTFLGFLVFGTGLCLAAARLGAPQMYAAPEMYVAPGMYGGRYGAKYR
jgi:hypothetical protein